MKHEWQILDEGMIGMISSPIRKCSHCNLTQRKRTLTNWMRVVGYKWEPLVGRCKGKNQKGETT